MWSSRNPVTPPGSLNNSHSFQYAESISWFIRRTELAMYSHNNRLVIKHPRSCSWRSHKARWTEAQRRTFGGDSIFVLSRRTARVRRRALTLKGRSYLRSAGRVCYVFNISRKRHSLFVLFKPSQDVRARLASF